MREAILFGVVTLITILGVVLVGPIINDMWTSNKVLEMNTFVATTFNNLVGRYQAQPDRFGTTEIAAGDLVAWRAVPDWSVRGTGQNVSVRNPWDGRITITGSDADLIIATEGLRVDVCSRLVSEIRPGSQITKVSVGRDISSVGSTWQNIPVAPSATRTLCANDRNAVAFLLSTR